jgi:TolA-binding protein
MIKKYTSTLLFLFLFGCSFGSESQSIDSSINPADLHSWLPADENELEQRRILQTKFDEIEKQIETLFLKFDEIGLEEFRMREDVIKVIPDITSMDKTISSMIDGEKKRIGILGQNIGSIRLENEKFDKELNNLSKTIKPDPVFSSKKYKSAFNLFKKRNYIKSSNLFRKSLLANPPYELTDNLLFGLAISQYRLGNISKVSGPLSRLILQYPESEKWHVSHLLIALVHYKKRESSQALHILEKGSKNNPPYFIQLMFKNLTQLIEKDL